MSWASIEMYNLQATPSIRTASTFAVFRCLFHNAIHTSIMSTSKLQDTVVMMVLLRFSINRAVYATVGARIHILVLSYI